MSKKQDTESDLDLSVGELDEKNKSILEILKRDGRASYADIAKEVEMNESTVRKRITKLVEEGLIDHFTVVMNPRVDRKNVISFLTIIPQSHYKIDGLSKELIELPEVVEAFYMSGKCGLLCKVRVESLNELDQLLEQLRDVHGIGEIESCIVIRQLKASY